MSTSDWSNFTQEMKSSAWDALSLYPRAVKQIRNAIHDRQAWPWIALGFMGFLGLIASLQSHSEIRYLLLALTWVMVGAGIGGAMATRVADFHRRRTLTQILCHSLMTGTDATLNLVADLRMESTDDAVAAKAAHLKVCRLYANITKFQFEQRNITHFARLYDTTSGLLCEGRAFEDAFRVAYSVLSETSETHEEAMQQIWKAAAVLQNAACRAQSAVGKVSPAHEFKIEAPVSSLKELYREELQKSVNLSALRSRFRPVMSTYNEKELVHG